MDNNSIAIKPNITEIRKSYMWILSLASLGMWVGLFLKIYILNTVYVSKSATGGIGLPTANPNQIWLLEFVQIVSPVIGAFLGFAIEKKRNYEINIIWKTIGYLLIIPTLLFAIFWTLLSLNFGGSTALIYFVPLVIAIVLCLVKK